MGGPVAILKDVPVTPKKIYRLQCWVRTEGIVERSATVRLNLQWRDRSGAWQGRYNLMRSLKISNEAWQLMDVYLRVPPIDSPKLVPLLVIHGSKGGRMWLDDVKLERIDDSGRAPEGR